MNEKKAGFFAGLAGGFGFYVAWMILALSWQTSKQPEMAVKAVVGFFLGLVVGILLYLGVYYLVNKKREATISKRITRYSTLGIAAGLLVAFLFGLLLYDPTTLWMPVYGVFGFPTVIP